MHECELLDWCSINGRVPYFNVVGHIKFFETEEVSSSEQAGFQHPFILIIFFFFCAATFFISLNLFLLHSFVHPPKKENFHQETAKEKATFVFFSFLHVLNPQLYKTPTSSHHLFSSSEIPQWPAHTITCRKLLTVRTLLPLNHNPHHPLPMSLACIIALESG